MFYGDKRGENTWDGYDVYTINTDGSGLRRLTHGNYDCLIRPRFSPDGTYVLFEATTPKPLLDGVCIARIDSAGVGTPGQLTNTTGERLDTCPYFFPDGKKFVYVANTNGDLKLYVMTLIGGATIELQGDRAGGGGFQPIVTANGKTIYFLGYGGYWVMGADGSHPHLVAGSDVFGKP